MGRYTWWLQSQQHGSTWNVLGTTILHLSALPVPLLRQVSWDPPEQWFPVGFLMFFEDGAVCSISWHATSSCVYSLFGSIYVISSWGYCIFTLDFQLGAKTHFKVAWHATSSCVYCIFHAWSSISSCVYCILGPSRLPFGSPLGPDMQLPHVFIAFFICDEAFPHVFIAFWHFQDSFWEPIGLSWGLLFEMLVGLWSFLGILWVQNGAETSRWGSQKRSWLK